MASASSSFDGPIQDLTISHAYTVHPQEGAGLFDRVEHSFSSSLAHGSHVIPGQESSLIQRVDAVLLADEGSVSLESEPLYCSVARRVASLSLLIHPSDPLIEYVDSDDEAGTQVKAPESGGRYVDELAREESSAADQLSLLSDLALATGSPQAALWSLPRDSVAAPRRPSQTEVGLRLPHVQIGGQGWLVATQEGTLDLIVESVLKNNSSFRGSIRSWAPGWLLGVQRDQAGNVDLQEGPALPVVFRRVGSCEEEEVDVAQRLALSGLAPHELLFAECRHEGGRPEEAITFLRVTERLPISFDAVIQLMDPLVQWQALQQIAEKLSMVHAAGYAHLDVKPDNIVCALAPRATTRQRVDAAAPMGLRSISLCDWGSAAPLESLQDLQAELAVTLQAGNVTPRQLLQLKGTIDALLMRGATAFQSPEATRFLDASYQNGPALLDAVGALDLAKQDVWACGLLILMVVDPSLMEVSIEGGGVKRRLKSHIQELRSMDQDVLQSRGVAGRLQAVALQCLEPDPLQRPLMEQLADVLHQIDPQEPL